MREVHAVYCPECRAELDRFINDGSAAFEVHRHHHEAGHHATIATGPYELEVPA
jgi:hypothetical protein